MFSQRIVQERGCYDPNNRPYIECTVENNNSIDIVCMVFEVEYYFDQLQPYEELIKTVVVKEFVLKHGRTKFMYYIPKHVLEPKGHRLIKVIYEDGSYQKF